MPESEQVDTPQDTYTEVYVSTAEAARIVGIARVTLQQWIQQGRLPAWRTTPEDATPRYLIRRVDLSPWVGHGPRKRGPKPRGEGPAGGDGAAGGAEVAEHAVQRGDGESASEPRSRSSKS